MKTKFIKASLAVLVSVLTIVNFICNWKLSEKQDLLTKAINAGDIIVTKCETTVWKTMTEEQYNKTDFGYIPSPSRYQNLKTGIESKLIYFTEELVWINQNNNKRVTGSTGFITVEDGFKEAKRLGFDTSRSTYTLGKHIQFQFTIKNRGKTYTKNTKFNVTATSNPDTTEAIDNTGDNPEEFQSDEEWKVTINYNIGINRPIPKQITFKIELNWVDIYNEKNTKTIKILWTSENDNFKILNYE